MFCLDALWARRYYILRDVIALQKAFIFYISSIHIIHGVLWRIHVYNIYNIPILLNRREDPKKKNMRKIVFFPMNE